MLITFLCHIQITEDLCYLRVWIYSFILRVINMKHAKYIFLNLSAFHLLFVEISGIIFLFNIQHTCNIYIFTSHNPVNQIQEPLAPTNDRVAISWAEQLSRELARCGCCVPEISQFAIYYSICKYIFYFSCVYCQTCLNLRFTIQ